MKNTLQRAMQGMVGLRIVIALVAVITFSMMGCKEPDNPPTVTLTGITAVYNQTATVYPNTPLDSLKAGLTVTAKYSDNSTRAVTDYELSGTLTVPSSAVTVTYEGKATTFNVTVTAVPNADITYTATQTGGANNTANTTGIAFTFSASVTGLTIDHISVTSGNGSVTKGALSGSGASWTLGVTVITPGNVTVTIDKSGIEAEPKDVTVFKEGQANPTLNSISAVYNGTTTIYPSTPLNDLKAGLTVTATYSTGAPQQVMAYKLSISGSDTLTVGTSTVTVTYEGKETTFTVTVTEPPAAHTHVWGEWTVTTAATCSSTGVGLRYCTECNEQDTNTVIPINPNAHQLDPNYIITQPTCTTAGQGAVVCLLNPAHSNPTAVVLLPVNPDAHDWNTAYTTISAATETADGIKAITCKHNNAHTKDAEFSGEYATGTAGLSFTAISNNTAYSVSKGTVTSGAVHIPAYHRPDASSQYLPVTEIGLWAFENCTSLTSITFAEGNQLATISGYAFDGCSSLAGIIIPDSVTNIGDAAFRSTNLTSITIPEGVPYIRGYVFSGCTSLASVTIPEGVTSIGAFAFSGCTSITGITLPASVRMIQTGAFENCTSLANINIPASVTSINGYVFSGCTGLTSITIPASVTSIGLLAFSNCTGLASITIPAGVTSIGQQAFSSCTGLTSVTIGEGVTSIGNEAFSGCTSLTSITIVICNFIKLS